MTQLVLGDDFVDGLENEDPEIIQDIKLDKDSLEVTVHSRDWTVETIYSQISQKNIDLNPKYQRRNAWNDKKRSRLIESLILGYPVPEIVIAENLRRKKSFVVIDGKQRLLTLAGFINPLGFEYWDSPKLSGLEVLKNLNGVDFEKLKKLFSNELRELFNADIRSTFITSYKKDDVLYDIFYRLNTGSVQLSSQELRQVLNKGHFADYLINITNDPQPIHKVLGLSGPDRRLRDAEILLRYFAFYLKGSEYRGNLKKFLDDTMGEVTKNWEIRNAEIDKIYSDFNVAINRLKKVFSKFDRIGRKYSDGGFESRFNKALFEVQAYYFTFVEENKLTSKNIEKFIENFQLLCTKNIKFKEAIETTTKTPINTYVRYNSFREIINKSFSIKIQKIPVALKQK